MAINPNVDFTAGAVYTADQANRYPRGVMALATSTTAYTLTTTETIATGMTVTFTAVANRYYRITYFEPQAQAPQPGTPRTTATIRQTNAAGTVLNSTIMGSSDVGINNTGMVCISNNTFTAGSITVVGTALTSSTGGAPQMVRSATLIAFLLVEDIGLA